jgi:hypothetical protein
MAGAMESSSIAKKRSKERTMRTFFRRTIAIGLVLGLVSAAFAQSTGWSAVQALPAGEDISVETKSGENFQGSVIAVDDRQITIWSRERNFPGRKLVRRDIPREVVRRVRTNHRLLSALTGAGIGIAAGVAIGAAVDARARSNEDNGVLGAALGLLIGAGGALLGKTHPFIHGKTPYQAP